MTAFSAGLDGEMRLSPIVFGNPLKDALEIAQRLVIDDNPHAPGSRNRFRASASET